MKKIALVLGVLFFCSTVSDDMPVNAQDKSLLDKATHHYFNDELESSLKEVQILLSSEPKNLYYHDLRLAIYISLANAKEQKDYGDFRSFKSASPDILRVENDMKTAFDQAFSIIDGLPDINSGNVPIDNFVNKSVISLRKAEYVLERTGRLEASKWIEKAVKTASQCLAIDHNLTIPHFVIGVPQYEIGRRSAIIKFIIEAATDLDDLMSFDEREGMSRLILVANTRRYDFRVIEAQTVLGTALVEKKDYKKAIFYLRPLAEFYPDNKEIQSLFRTAKLGLGTKK